MYIKNTAPFISRRSVYGKNASFSGRSRRGFALVVTITLMILLMLLAVGMLSLSTVTLRSSNSDSATNEARANARMALMIAIGELQKEMGPDMRISAEAAIHDTNPATEKIDGVAQPHWLAVYDSWGNYLNGEYTPEGKLPSEVKTIADTYAPKRAPMFRRWLVSLPESLKNDVNAADTKLSEEDTVLMVGTGTLGEDFAAANPNKVTRAYKIQTDDSGSFAWWISPENHKAKIGLAAQKRELNADQWAVAQGASAEAGIGGITGLETLDSSNANAASMANRIISFKTLELSGAEEETAKSMFFDLTEVSSGVLSNTRSGGLKKDLSLLFENSNTTIAPEYTQANRFAPEPSIRPHSKDVLAENAALPRRPFASWPNMRHYYRMYRTDKDSAFPPRGAYDTSRNLRHNGGAPYASILAPDNIRDYDKDLRWFGENAYQRFPVVARYLLIHAYATKRFFDTRTNREEIAFYYIDIPVVTLWNPYSTPLVIKNRDCGAQITSGSTWPHRIQMFFPDGRMDGLGWRGSSMDAPVPFGKADGTPITFKPGEFKVFSFPGGARFEQSGGNVWSDPDFYLQEGFDPSSTGGITVGNDPTWLRISVNGVLPNRSFEVQTDKARGKNGAEGNTPGSLTLKIGRNRDWKDDGIPPHYQIDWFNVSQQHQSITQDESGGLIPLIESEDALPVGYSLMTLKGVSRIDTPAAWSKDWRTRNWLHSPPYYFGSGLYMSEDATTAHTQRLDSPYEVSFGPTSPSELIKLTGEIDGKPWLGFGSNPYEKVTAVPAIELPTAPVSSLASFSGMRMTSGWIYADNLNPDWRVRQRTGENTTDHPFSLYGGGNKIFAYQSGMIGGGIGNSFVHPMIPRGEVYFHHDNSISHDIARRDLFGKTAAWAEAALNATEPIETKAYSDYWDHALVLNDALWDDCFISSIADQTRPWATESDNLQANIQALTNNEPLPISRYKFYNGGLEASEVRDKLQQEDAYLRVAEHLTVDGAFNVNSTSVNAWYALFKGIRERKLFYRNTTTGNLSEVEVPSDHIALSRFDTPTSGQESTDLSGGLAREDGQLEWSGVRFLDDDQIRLLAEKCVEQVKRRGPFLNFSEFINRRLENSELGLMGALQSAIDFDDANPQSGSINYEFKSSSGLRISPNDLGTTDYPTPEAVEGSRLAGIPGYVIQSDLLKPIANTLQVRDDTFRVRAYGEALDSKGNVTARAWCEAIVQRNPEYVDPDNAANEPAFVYEGNPVDAGYDPKWNGEFTANPNLSATNQRFGRKFEIKSFRWLASEEL